MATLQRQPPHYCPGMATVERCAMATLDARSTFVEQSSVAIPGGPYHLYCQSLVP